MLREQLKVLVLDDTNTSKTKQIEEQLRNDETWEIIYKSQNRRNGELIATKK